MVIPSKSVYKTLEVSDAYDAGMPRYMGCTAFAPEAATAMGDDIAAKQLYSPMDFGRNAELLPATLTRLGKGMGPLKRTRVVAGQQVVEDVHQLLAHLGTRLLGVRAAPLRTALKTSPTSSPMRNQLWTRSSFGPPCVASSLWMYRW